MLLNFRKQNENKLVCENNKLASDLLNNVYEALYNLISIKKNYFGMINDDPYQRVRQVPVIINYNIPIKDYAETISIIPIADNKKSDRKKDWSELEIISNMVRDYNILLKLWKLRNNYMKKLSDFFDQGTPSEMIMDSERSIDFIHLIDLTELVIKFTDDHILLVIEFLEEFGAVADNSISDNKTEVIDQTSIEDMLKPDKEILKETRAVNSAQLKYILKQSEMIPSHK